MGAGLAGGAGLVIGAGEEEVELKEEMRYFH